MAYDAKFREAVLRHIDAGHTYKATGLLFGLGDSTIAQWKRLRDETGGLKKRPLNRTWTKIDPERLRADVETRPADSDAKRARRFGCSESGMQNALKRHKLTPKKARSICRARRG
ncbi:MAG: IS630 transposase-related protein [Oscillospiraceae bacterium]|nr:IS630 transposase-related protein [Oscillospiraceae bacterium]